MCSSLHLTVLLCPFHLLPSTHQRCYNHPYRRKRDIFADFFPPLTLCVFLCVHVCWQLESRYVSLIIANDGCWLMRGFLHARSRFIFGSHKKREREGMCCACQEDYESICETGRILAYIQINMGQYEYFHLFWRVISGAVI